MSRLDFSKKIQKHDWFYAYSDDNRWFTAGQLERKEINHLQAVLGCPFSLDKLFKWANRMIIEEFLEEVPGEWFRQPRKYKCVAPSQKKDLMTQKEWDEIQDWMNNEEI